MKYAFVFLLLSLSLAGLSQTSVSGKLLAADDSLPVANAFLKIGNYTAYSQKDGSFSLEIGKGDSTLEIFHPGYKHYIALLSREKHTVIYLVPDVRSIKEVTVSAKNNQGNSGVIDFALIDDRLVVSKFVGSRQYFEIRQVADGFPVIARVPDPFPASGLFRDCFGRTYITTSTSAFQLTLQNDTPHFGNANSLALFLDFYTSCVIADAENKLYKKMGWLDKGVTFYHDNDQFLAPREVYTAFDEYGYGISNRLRRDPRRTLQSNTSPGDQSKESYDLNAFYKASMARKVYVGVFDINGNWWFFDPYKKSGFIYNSGLKEPVGRFSFDPGRESRHSFFEMIQSDNLDLYIKQQQRNNGAVYLQQFNTDTRRAEGAVTKLTGNFPGKILISGNTIIYSVKNGFGYYELKFEEIGHK